MARRRSGGSSGGDDAYLDLDTAAFEKSLARELRALDLRSEADLMRVGLRVQNEARKLCPVDTGRLRSSIQATPGRDGRGPYVEVGTNVEYAPFVEYGTRYTPMQPFMRPALMITARALREEAGR